MPKLERELENLPHNYIVGVVMPSESYEDTNMQLLKFLINKKNNHGGYVSISKPSHHIISLLKNKKINTDNLYFIDCITKCLGVELTKANNCVFIESPAHLTELSTVLHEYFVSNINKNRFLYIDSLSTLCIHNKSDSVLKFIHYITGKMRIFGFNGVMLSLHEETDKKLIEELGQFCDKIIHL